MPKGKSLLKEPSRQPGRFRLTFTRRLDEVADFYKQHGRYPDPAEGSVGHWVYLVRKDWEAYPEDRAGLRARALESFPNWSWSSFRESSRSPFIQQLTDWYASVDGIADSVATIPEFAEVGYWLHRNRKVYASGKMEESRIAELEAIPHWTWKSRNHTLDPKRSVVERELSWMVDNSTDSLARSGGVTGFSGKRHSCDIVIADHKIIIEHDGRLWHADRQDEDDAKTIDLENAGWQVIRVREEPLEVIAGINVCISMNASMAETHRAVIDALSDLGVNTFDVDFASLGRVPGSRVPYYDDWYSSLEAFQKYVSEGGSSTPIADELVGEVKLGNWVYTQRRDYRRGKLTERKKELLESIPGWQWELKPNVKLGWDATYQRLLEYQSENGEIPPARFKYDDGLKLGSWASAQRYEMRKGKLSWDRVEKLEKVPGWYW